MILSTLCLFEFSASSLMAFTDALYRNIVLRLESWTLCSMRESPIFLPWDGKLAIDVVILFW